MVKVRVSVAYAQIWMLVSLHDRTSEGRSRVRDTVARLALVQERREKLQKAKTCITTAMRLGAFKTRNTRTSMAPRITAKIDAISAPAAAGNDSGREEAEQPPKAGPGKPSWGFAYKPQARGSVSATGAPQLPGKKMKRATDVNPKTSTEIDDAAVLEIEEIDCSEYAALVQGANEVSQLARPHTFATTTNTAAERNSRHLRHRSCPGPTACNAIVRQPPNLRQLDSAQLDPH